MRPNLFQYATSELSQDAMICWLIAWAGQDGTDGDQELRRCARRFVEALLNHKRGDRVRLGEVVTTEIRRQDNKIDVLALINEQYMLLIEDKTETGKHGDQLPKGYQAVISGKTDFKPVNEEYVRPIFFKRGNQSLADDEEVEQCGYKTLGRSDLLRILKTYKGDNQILRDFRDYLAEIEEDTEAYRGWSRDERRADIRAWEGLYRRLEGELRRRTAQWMNWRYVSNRSGGFLGFWWQPLGVDENCPLYLQLEVSWWKESKGEKLCFKVDAEDKDDETKDRMKWEWHERVCNAGQGRAQRPARMRIGDHMTVAEWTGEWLGFGSRGRGLDTGRTVENLRQAEDVLIQAARQPAGNHRR